MSHSTHVGFSGPGRCSESGRELSRFAGEDDFQSRAVGVGQMLTAVERFGPQPPPRSLRGLASFAAYLAGSLAISVATGVGQIIRADTASIRLPPSRAFDGFTSLPFSPRLAVGVGHWHTNSAGLGVRPLANLGERTVIVAVGVPTSGVGDDPDAIPFVGERQGRQRVDNATPHRTRSKRAPGERRPVRESEGPGRFR